MVNRRVMDEPEGCPFRTAPCLLSVELLVDYILIAEFEVFVQIRSEVKTSVAGAVAAARIAAERQGPHRRTCGVGPLRLDDGVLPVGLLTAGAWAVIFMTRMRGTSTGRLFVVFLHDCLLMDPARCTLLGGERRCLTVSKAQKALLRRYCPFPGRLPLLGLVA